MSPKQKREVEREKVLRIVEDPQATSAQRQEAIGLAINRFGISFDAVIDLANEAEHKKSATKGKKR